MRAATQDIEILWRNKKFVGVSLGADFVSEHEWGIKPLKRALGIPERPTRDVCGFDARKPTEVPENHLHYKVEGDFEYLMFYPNFREGDEWPEIHYAPDRDTVTAWDESSFYIKSNEANGGLAKLYQAFKDLKVVVFLGASGPFQNGGLKICLAKRIPQKYQKEARDSDLDYMNMQAAATETGILERLADVDADTEKHLYDRRCAYHACSPRWKTENDPVTSHPVVFWLNPCHQQINNYGWYTVEELDQWIAGEGPVPFKNNEKRSF